MNNPWAMLAPILQRLPAPIRRSLYTLVTLAGAVLAAAQFFSWDLGIDLERALAAYAVLSSPTGVLALANVKPTDAGYAGFDPDFSDRDYDVASFEGGDAFGTWEETEVEDVDDEGAVDLSTEPVQESAELTDESSAESTEEPAFS